MLYKEYSKTPDFEQLTRAEIIFLRVNWTTEDRRKKLRLKAVKDRARQRAEAAKLMREKHPTLFSPSPPKHP